MISFFASPAFCAPAPAVRPQQSSTGLVNLFRLLDDFDSYHSREVQAPHQQRQRQQQRAHDYALRRAAAHRQMQAFKPRFDVLETQTAYELQGDLPGIERENLVIEFADPQTLVVRGRVERSTRGDDKSETQDQQTTTPAEAETQAEAAEAATTTETENAMQITSDDNDDDAASTTSSKGSSQGWHHATVEDDPEEPATPRSATPVEAETETSKKAEEKTPAAVVPAPQNSEAPAAQAQAPKNKEKLWLYERSVGKFSRAFTFAARVEHEGVTASLQNGVLRVTVPKAKQHQPRRIVVF